MFHCYRICLTGNYRPDLLTFVCDALMIQTPGQALQHIELALGISSNRSAAAGDEVREWLVADDGWTTHHVFLFLTMTMMGVFHLLVETA